MYSIDRFEGEVAVLEGDEGFREVLRTFLPEEAAEGSLVDWNGSSWVLCTEATDERRRALAERRRRLLEGNR